MQVFLENVLQPLLVLLSHLHDLLTDLVRLADQLVDLLEVFTSVFYVIGLVSHFLHLQLVVLQ